MKYRKKPVVIEAYQFRVANKAFQPNVHLRDGEYWTDTLEGPLRVSDGDWIITGIKGEHYPCKPDIFEATYEPAE